MAALVEYMFSVRQTPWHGQGLVVEDAPTSEDAIRLAGLDWKVEQKEMFLADGTKIPDAFANVRDKDNRVLGVVGNRYSIVQNSEAFSFTDSLIGEGCQYETAGSLRDGKQIWLLAHLPEAIQIAGDDVMPYLCFTNTHDGTGSVKVFTTGIRVVCNNTLNQALSNAKRTWSVRHTGSIETKLAVATETLNLANNYMAELKKECEELALKPVDKDKVIEFIKFVVPEEDDMSQRQKTNIRDIRNDIWYRYTYAPDLRDRGQNCLRFLNAVSDTVSHKEPTRRTANYDENHFISLISGDKMLDKAYQICKTA